MKTAKIYLGVLYQVVVAGNQKAVVAFVVPLVLGGIAFTGITGDMTVEDALSLLLTSIITAGGVWLKKNK